MSAENSSHQNEAWLTSQEVRAKLRLSSCHLMHLREAGQLKFQKKGNAFFYAKEDVVRLAREVSAPA